MVSRSVLKRNWDSVNPHRGECYRCGHSWFRRSSKVPSACPRCHSEIYYKRKKGGS